MGIRFPIQILFNIWLSWQLASLPSILNSKHSAFHHYCASSSLVMVTAFQQSCTKHRNVKPSGSFNTGKLWQVETLYLPISKYFQTTCWIEWHSSRIQKCFGPKVLEGKSHYTSRPSKKKKKKRKNPTYCYQLQSNPEEQTKRWTLYRMYLISVQFLFLVLFF